MDMTDDDSVHRITTTGALDALYSQPAERSVLKETTYLTDAYRALIAASPFVTLATCGPGGLDCSPRGDGPGFVRVLDPTTLALPDRRGNNRIDSLRNIVIDPRVALLFLVRGHGETLRVNGHAILSTKPELLASFTVDGHAPVSVMIIRIQSVYFQCARAVMRAQLWQPAGLHVATSALPSAGRMIKEAIAAHDLRQPFDDAAYDTALPERQKASLY